MANLFDAYWTTGASLKQESSLLYWNSQCAIPLVDQGGSWEDTEKNSPKDIQNPVRKNKL